jgi:hypothetical protein
MNDLKAIPALPPAFWKDLGQKVVQWIREDASKGHFQNDTSDHYRSLSYKNYKKNDMRKKDGKRLNKYYATSITSNETSFVNLTLTGALLKGLKVITQNAYSVTLGWISSRETIGKLLGAERYKRELRGLNEKNIIKAKELLAKQFNENVSKLSNININIRF